MSRCSETEWTELSADPDPQHDLGYEMVEWDVVRASNGSDQLIFLPQDDELLKDDAFIVAEPDAIADVRTNI